jgi:hypothetical protein
MEIVFVLGTSPKVIPSHLGFGVFLFIFDCASNGIGSKNYFHREDGFLVIFVVFWSDYYLLLPLLIYPE